MKRDLSNTDFAGLMQQHEQRQERARHEFEANPSARKRFGGSLFAVALFWLAFFLAINVPAIWRFFFN